MSSTSFVVYLSFTGLKGSRRINRQKNALPGQSTIHIRHVLFLTASTHDTLGEPLRLHCLSATSADYVNIQLGREQPPYSELSISYLLIYLFLTSALWQDKKMNNLRNPINILSFIINFASYGEILRNLLKRTSRINSYMEMMNSCSTVIPCKYLVFNLVLS